MAKLVIVAARALQILGHDGTVEPGTELATIETECDLGGLLSHMQFGAAVVKTDDDGDETDEGEEVREKNTDPIVDAIIAEINAEVSPPLTNKQIVERLAAAGTKVSINKVAAVRRTLKA